MRVVFMYGGGDGGPAGWPTQSAVAEPDWLFLDRLPADAADPVPYDDPWRDTARIVEAIDRGAHLVAHSWGAVPALLAVASEPTAVRSLTLFEPACFGLSLGRPGTVSLVAAMSSVFDRSADAGTSDGEFTRDFMVAMGAPAVDPTGPGVAAFGARLRLGTPPWQVPLSPDLVATVPTLVVTGGWSPAFDEVADVLVAAGARHVVVPGTGHRSQNHPDGHAAMTAFQAAHHSSP